MPKVERLTWTLYFQAPGRALRRRPGEAALVHPAGDRHGHGNVVRHQHRRGKRIPGERVPNFETRISRKKK